MQFRLRDRAGFTLVEIMIVVGIITLLAALALPGMLRARKRAQASRIKDDLRLIEAAVDQYAIETQRAARLGGVRPRLDRLSEKRNATLHDGKGCARPRFRSADSRSNPNRPVCNLTPSLPMWPTTDFGPRLPHKTGIVPKFRFDETTGLSAQRPAGLQPAERNQNLSAGQPVK